MPDGSPIVINDVFKLPTRDFELSELFDRRSVVFNIQTILLHRRKNLVVSFLKPKAMQ